MNLEHLMMSFYRCKLETAIALKFADVWVKCKGIGITIPAITEDAGFSVQLGNLNKAPLEGND